MQYMDGERIQNTSVVALGDKNVQSYGLCNLWFTKYSSFGKYGDDDHKYECDLSLEHVSLTDVTCPFIVLLVVLILVCPKPE
jgi:hypothetical protein